MAGLLGGGGSQNSVVKRISSFQVQSSAYGNVIPMGWGRGRIAINLLWLDGFHSVKHKQEFGKGGGGGADSYSYYADIILGICDTTTGPIRSIVALYRDQDVFGDYKKAGFAGFAKGDPGQAYWSYLDNYDEEVRLGYDTIGYLFASNYKISDSATLQNHSVEVDFWVTSLLGSVHDANPGDRSNDGIISSFLKTAIPQFDPATIGDLHPYGTYCQAAGLFLSPVLDSPQQASAFIDEIMKASNSQCWMRGDGTFQVTPLGDQEITGNNVTYTPDMTPVYDLTDDDFIVDDPADDPIRIETENLDDLWNVRAVTFKDRAHQYDDNTVTANDQAAIDEFGERKADPDSLPCIKDIAVARKIAQLLVQQSANYRRPFVFKLPWCFDRLEEMDLVTVSNSSQSLNKVLCRIRQIDEDEDGTFTIYADEVLIGTGTAADYDAQGANGGGIDHGAEADGGGEQNNILFNAPMALTNDELQIWGAVAGTSPEFGGVEFWIGLDGETYDYVGRSEAKATFGYVTAAIASSADFDAVSILEVDLSASGGTLVSATAALYQAAARLCWLNGELIAYRDAELIGPNKYRLTGLRRGLYDTQPANHLVGAPFVLLNDQIYKYTYQEEQVGKTAHIKLPTFHNVAVNNVQDLSDVPDNQIVLMPQERLLESVASLAATAVVAANMVTGALFWRLALRIECNEPQKKNLRARFEYQGPDAVAWQDCSPPPDQYTQDSILLSESGLFNVRARFETADGKVGPWTYTTVTVPAPGDLLTTDGGLTPVTIDGDEPTLVS